MKYRCSAFATARYGSGRAPIRALYCLYRFFWSSDPVTNSIHFSAMSIASFVEQLQSIRQEAPRLPELFEVFATLSVEGVHPPRRALLRRNLLHVDDAPLLDPDQHRVNGSLRNVGEPLLPEPRCDLVAVRGPAGQDGEDDPLQDALEHFRRLLGQGAPPPLLSVID